MKVLIIEDNLSLSRNIATFLEIQNINSETSFDWKDWLYKASINYYDTIILDVNLPELNWFQVCRLLREKQKDTPIIILTSNSRKSDIIKWLDLWADDYLIKPFDYEELVARIKALSRRNLKIKSNTKIKISDLNIDLEKAEVQKNNWEMIKLSNLEFELLKCLTQNKWKILSRKELYEKVWGEFDWDIMFSKTVDVYIWYLRKKLWKELIETKKWFWYIIN